MKIRVITAAMALLMSSGYGWYPDYSVMITDFVLPYDFLSPIRIPSIELQSLGPHFRDIYWNPVDNAFLNPAYLHFVDRHFVYLDVAGEESQPEVSPVRPMYPGSGYDFYPYYWSAYRYKTEPVGDQPIARAIYLGRPFRPALPLGAGFSFEYFYDQEKFYQPYWYWRGWWLETAAGVPYAEESLDPYEDYRVVESADNVQTETGYRINTFLSYAITSRVVVGVRYGTQVKGADGDYRDMDLRDESRWADRYLNFHDNIKDQAQEYKLHDLSVGAMVNDGNGSRLGLNLGYVVANIERDYLSTDTSRYYSHYFYGADTSKYSWYRNSSAALSDKNWFYDGNTIYGRLHGDIFVNPDVTLRFAIHVENREAELTESEAMWRRSKHSSKYWHSWDSIFSQYEYNSGASLERTGTGKYQFQRRRLSFGADWMLSKNIRFVGGVVFDKRRDRKDANEPFAGNKFSYYHRIYNGDYTQEITHEDEKRFKWYRNESYFTIAVPTGIVVEVGESFGFQIGLSKVIKRTDISEGYDLVVYHDRDVRTVDGVTISDEDSMYVEGHTFPGTHDFTDNYQMNAGLSFKYRDSFKITGALTESIIEPRSFKMGVEFLW